MTHFFQWQGIQDKHSVQGVLTAKNHADLAKKLNARHITLVSARKLKARKQFNTADLLLLFEQLLPLLRSGIPLLESIQMIATNETSNKRKHLLKMFADEMAGGRKISEILENHLSKKEKSIAKILALGEHNGCLTDMMEKLMTQKNRERQVRKRFLQALTYPAFLAVISVAVMLVLTVWIVPEFEKTYAQMQMTLPVYTQITVAFSHALIQHGFSIAMVLLGSIVVLRIVVPLARPLQYFIAQMQLHLPCIGKLYKAYHLRHFASNLGVSYQAGMPINEALTWLCNTTPQHVYRQALKQLQQQVSNGVGLKKAIENTPFFPTRVLQFIAVGERSGHLEEALHSIEKYYDEQLETSIARLLSLLEPVLIVWIAICIGWIVVTMYLPIFNLGYAF